MAPPQAARRFHQAGVGSRTGLQISSVERDDDGFENLDDFYLASRNAMKQREMEQQEQDESMASTEPDASYISYASKGRKSNASVGVSRRVASSSMMDIQNSSAPSPRSTLRKSMGANDTFAVSVLDYDDIPGSSSHHSFQQSSRGRNSYLNRDQDDSESDNGIGLAGNSSRSFDLSTMAGDDAVAMEGEVEEDETSPRRPSTAAKANKKRALSAGLAAHKAGSKKGKAPASAKAALQDSDEETYQVPQKAQPTYLDSDDEEEQEQEDDTILTVEDRSMAESMHEEPSFNLASQSIESVDYNVRPSASKGTTTAKAQKKVAAPPKPRPVPAKKAPVKKAVKQKKADTSKYDDTTIYNDTTAYDDTAIYDDTTILDNSASYIDKRALEAGDTTRDVIQQVRGARVGSVDVDGVRRGTRHRFAPLEWWRGERVRYGRPSLPSGMTAADLHVQSGGAGEDEFEDHPAMIRSVPVPVVKEVIRIPRAPGEGTFAGTKRVRVKRQGSAAVRKKARKSEGDEDEFEDQDIFLDPTADTLHPEDGWDAETTAFGIVLNAETREEEEKRIVCTSSSIQPRQAYNQNFSFEKVFSIDSTMAAGMLVLPVGGSKPTKPSQDNNYVFVVLQGALKVKIHRRIFTIAPGGTFLVPAGNTYAFENVCQREVRLFFAQSRKGSPEELANLSLMSFNMTQSTPRAAQRPPIKDEVSEAESEKSFQAGRR